MSILELVNTHFVITCSQFLHSFRSWNKVYDVVVVQKVFECLQFLPSDPSTCKPSSLSSNGWCFRELQFSHGGQSWIQCWSDFHSREIPSQKGGSLKFFVEAPKKMTFSRVHFFLVIETLIRKRSFRFWCFVWTMEKFNVRGSTEKAQKIKKKSDHYKSGLW